MSEGEARNTGYSSRELHSMLVLPAFRLRLRGHTGEMKFLSGFGQAKKRYRTPLSLLLEQGPDLL